MLKAFSALGVVSLLCLSLSTGQCVASDPTTNPEVTKLIKKAVKYVRAKPLDPEAPQLHELSLSYMEATAGDLGDRLLRTYDQLAAKVRGNENDPAELVNDIVSMSIAQLRLYGVAPILSRESLFNLREMVSNGTPDFLTDVIRNFKSGLRKQMRAEETYKIDIRTVPAACYDPESVLCLQKLYGAGIAVSGGKAKLRDTVRHQIHDKVNTHAKILNRFLVAFPLLKRMADVIEGLEMEYRGLDRDAAIGPFKAAVLGIRTGFSDLEMPPVINAGRK
jgi:hypothetical protein